MRGLRSKALFATAFMMVPASQVSAAQFTFDFATNTALIGGPGSGSGILTTDDLTFASRGFMAQSITAISGTFNGSPITGLGSAFGSNNLFYVTGPSFVDGSGLAFNTEAGTTVNLFFQSSGSRYRINTTGPFTSSFVNASALAAPAPAVPEPSSWAMMLMGFGAAGYSMRKIRRAKFPRVA